MKLSHVVVLAFNLSFAASRAQPVLKVTGSSDSQALTAKTAAQTISVDLLGQPLSRKARQLLEKAQHAANAGDHARAIGFLETVHAKYPESDAWTQSMLGVEYLKTGQFTSALHSLEQAVLLLPRDAVDRSNLGFALAATGQYDRAEVELRRAIALDHDNLKTRELLNVVLAANALKPSTASQPGASANVVSSR